MLVRIQWKVVAISAGVALTLTTSCGREASMPATATANAGASTPAPMSPAPAAGASTNMTPVISASGAGGAVGSARGAAQGGAPAQMPSPSSMTGGGGMVAAAPAGAGGSNGGAPSAGTSGAVTCPQRMVQAEARLHFHHVHFNSASVADDIAYYVKFFDVKAMDFCKGADDRATPAVRTDKGYLLFSTVAAPPDKGLNVYLEHVGWSNQDPTMELRRQMMLGIKIWPPNDVRQCAEVAQGMACSSTGTPNNFYFLEAPNGARIEVSRTPGPSTSGFAHMHLNGDFPDFYARVLGEALQNASGTPHIDGVNLTNVGRQMIMPPDSVDSHGKPIDHIAFSTGDIDGTLQRIKSQGIEPVEALSFKPEFGFRSFMVKSPQGVWIEIVEDAPFSR